MFISLLWFIGDTAIEFVFPTYLDDIGIPFWQIGVLLSLVSLSGMMIDMPVGNLSDIFSRKKIMFAGLVLSPVFAYLIFSYTKISLLVIYFLLWGAAFQIWRVPRDVYLTALTKKDKRAEYFGIDLEFQNLGCFIGPMIGGFLLSYFGIISNLIFYTIACVIAAIMVMSLLKTQIHSSKPRREIEHDMSFKKTYLKDFRYAKSLGFNTFLLFLFSSLFTTWQGALWTIGPLLYSTSGLDPTYGGMLIAFFYLPSIFLGFPFGKLADKVGKDKVFIAGLFVCGMSLVVFSQTVTLSGLIIAALMVSTGSIMALPALNGLIIDKSYKHTKGEITGILDFFRDFGYVIGPLSAGFFAHIVGIKASFLIFGLIFILSIIPALFLKEEE